MELLQLKYFCVLAQREHLINTATCLMVSPPSLSQTISKLEKELGVPLFDRVGRNITLNENDRLFYRYISESLSLIDTAVEELRQANGKTVSVGVANPNLWREFFQAFESSYPDLSLKIKVLTPKELGLKKNPGVTFYLGNGWDLQASDWEKQQIQGEEDTILLVSNSHPLATRKTISVRDLENETFITLGKVYPSSQKFVFDLCQMCGFVPKKIIEADYFLRIKLLKENQGVVLTSELGYVSNFIDDGSFVKIPVTEPEFKRYQVLAWRKGMKFSSGEETFRNAILTYYSF